jgi:hypothetical protein
MKKEDYEVLCVCGHTLEDHHLSHFAHAGGAVIAEECEFYGFNEFGGMIQDENGYWIRHCYRFTPVKEEVNE